MPSSPLLDQVRAIARLKHLSYRTECTYVHSIKRFILFHQKRHPASMGAAEIQAYLVHLAIDRQVAASTQNVALSALLFLYREVLHITLPTIDLPPTAQRPRTLPVVFTRAEVDTILRELHGIYHLMASLLYGSGLRLMECLRLWVLAFRRESSGGLPLESSTPTQRVLGGFSSSVKQSTSFVIMPLGRHKSLETAHIFWYTLGMRTLHKAFRYRIRPTNDQQQRLAVQFGHARFIYNHYRALCEQTYKAEAKTLRYTDCTADLVQLKVRYPWLADADSQVLQQSLKDLDRAYQNFFAARARYPAFKSKHDRQSIRYPQRFKLLGNTVYLPKVGNVAVIVHRPLEGTPKNCTVSKTKTGAYYVSIQCEVTIPQPPPLPETVGIDLGLADFATLSTGEKIAPPRELRKAERHLKIRQRRLSRKTKGSSSRSRARQIVAQAHEQVVNRRRDFHHQLSRQIANRFGCVVVENLHIVGLLQNHSLAKSISDAGWAQFVRLLSYKVDWAGGSVVKADRFFASTKLCSVCGERNANMTLKDRAWTCPVCQTIHNRDINAAINLSKLPLEQGKVTPVETRVPAGARPRKPKRGTLG